MSGFVTDSSSTDMKQKKCHRSYSLDRRRQRNLQKSSRYRDKCEYLKWILVERAIWISQLSSQTLVEQLICNACKLPTGTDSHCSNP